MKNAISRIVCSLPLSDDWLQANVR